MNGIDVSAWQPANVTEIVKDYDFVIIKATEGTSYVSPVCNTQYQIAKKRGKKLGVYHFATGADPVAEANFFVKNVKGYIGEAILVLDWEADAINRGREWVRSFVRQVKATTGVPPIIYGSASPMRANSIPALAKEENCGIWIAAYPNNNVTGYRNETQLLGSVIRQYTSSGRLANYGGNLDLNISTLTPAQWDLYAHNQRSVNKPKPVAPAKPVRKSDDEIANEVLLGRWGNGNDRKRKLAQAGYNYNVIQNLVNKKINVSKAVYHVVLKGENLSIIANRYGTNWRKIAKLNNLANPNLIYAGQRLRIK